MANRVRLNAHFEPLDETWAEYCEDVLRRTHADPTRATIEINAEFGAVLLHHADFEQPAWFKCLEGHDRIAATTSAWALYLGHAGLLVPHVETSTAKASLKEYFFLSLRLQYEIDVQHGLFRACSKLILDAAKLSQADIDTVFALHRKLEELGD